MSQSSPPKVEEEDDDDDDESESYLLPSGTTTTLRPSLLSSSARQRLSIGTTSKDSNAALMMSPDPTALHQQFHHHHHHHRFDVTNAMDRLRQSIAGTAAATSTTLAAAATSNTAAIEGESSGNILLDNHYHHKNYYNSHNNDDDDDPDVAAVACWYEDATTSIGTATTTAAAATAAAATTNVATDSSNNNSSSSSSRWYNAFCYPVGHSLLQTASQLPAILLITMFHLLIGIPFGVSYFPVSWTAVASAHDDNNNNNDIDNNSSHPYLTDVDADPTDSRPATTTFPLPDKDALGIRMFLFSTIIGQIFFTLQSGFHSPIGLQMVENVPFCHTLALIVFRHQGYGRNALSTLFVMFGLSSLIVGMVFWWLGTMKLGRIVYYFPAHVLVGCIGGIGLYISKTGVEVTTNRTFGYDSVFEHGPLLVPVAWFEIMLRLLERCNVDHTTGQARFPLLFPIYFCLVTPMFYFALYLFGVSVDDARTNGYFFPSLVGGVHPDCTSGDGAVVEAIVATCTPPSLWQAIWTPHLFDLWHVIDLSTVSWNAIVDAIPTLIALTLFSLIHVPINIPAFAVSSGVDVDMNDELIAHGYSNMVAGALGGLQNYMAYTQSVLYDKSGGRGKASGYLVALATAVLFLIGPAVASYIPRCMAGSLLLHVGIDLFLEGVYDSTGKFDSLEYSSIWLITMTMTVSGMEAAIVVGAISAVATHAFQSVHYVNPIRGSMTATTLRSSHWNRTNDSQAILEDGRLGRSRVFVVQLQGHLFFGNTARLTESLNELIRKQQAMLAPWILIVDFALVLGIDSSAAQTMVKLMSAVRKKYSIHSVVWVTGSDNGFPTEYGLMESFAAAVESGDGTVVVPARETTNLISPSYRWRKYSGNKVAESLDEALLYAEDALLHHAGKATEPKRPHVTSDNEHEIARLYLSRLVPEQVDHRSDAIAALFSLFVREEYNKGDCIWMQGSTSDCVKLLVRGELVAVLENEAGTVEAISEGNTIGELGLLQGLPRMSSVYCESASAVAYTLSRNDFEGLCASAPQAARLIDLICIRYLSARVQVRSLETCIISSLANN